MLRPAGEGAPGGGNVDGRDVGKAEIDQVWWAAKASSEWDNLYGGLAREAPVAQLRWSAGLLRRNACPLELQSDRLSACTQVTTQVQC